MKPKISILIPCYNAEKWIRQSIESGLNQTYPNKEIIVVDDGSTDRSLEIIKSFGDSILWETGVNRGGNIARNRLLELSTGEWLQYLDADDYLLPEKIENQIEFLSSQSQVDIIYSLAICEFVEGDRTKQSRRTNPESSDPWILLARWLLPQTGGMLWRKQAIMDAGGWKVDQPCCQEHELCLRLLLAGKHFAFCDQSGAIYRIWSNGTISRKNIWEVYRQRLIIGDILEQHLKAISQLNKPRQDAINQGRFECARIIYTYDPEWADSIIAKIHAQDRYYIPSGNAAPPIYRFFYKTFGFSQAENFAKLKRLISSFEQKVVES